MTVYILFMILGQCTPNLIVTLGVFKSKVTCEESLKHYKAAYCVKAKVDE